MVDDHAETVRENWGWCRERCREEEEVKCSGGTEITQSAVTEAATSTEAGSSHEMTEMPGLSSSQALLPESTTVISTMSSSTFKVEESNLNIVISSSDDQEDGIHTSKDITTSHTSTMTEDDSLTLALSSGPSSPQGLVLGTTPTPILSSSSVSNIEVTSEASELSSSSSNMPETISISSDSDPTDVFTSADLSFVPESTSQKSTLDDGKTSTISFIIGDDHSDNDVSASALSTSVRSTTAFSSAAIEEDTLSFTLSPSIITGTKSTTLFTTPSASSPEQLEEFAIAEQTTSTSSPSTKFFLGEGSSLSQTESSSLPGTETLSPAHTTTREVPPNISTEVGTFSTTSQELSVTTPKEESTTITVATSASLSSTLSTSTEKTTTPVSGVMPDMEREGRGDTVACVNVGTCHNRCGRGSDLTCWCDQR